MKTKHKPKKHLYISGELNGTINSLKDILLSEFPDYEVRINDTIEDFDPYKSKNSYSKDELLDSEKYHFLFENTSHAIFLFDIESGSYLDANNSSLKLMGRDKDDLKSLKISDVTIRRLPDRENIYLDVQKDLSEIIVEFLRPDGSVRIARLHTLHFKGDQYFGIAHDITDIYHTKSEFNEQNRFYENLVDNLPGFIYQCKNDAYWTMILITKKCESITGYRPEDFIENKTTNFEELILDDYKEITRKKMQLALDSKKGFDFRYPIKTKDHQIKWLRERSIGIYTESGELSHIEGFITDDTEAVRYENVQKALFKISSSVVHSIDLPSLISEIKIELGKVIDTTNFYIALYERENDTFSLPFFSDEKDQIESLPAGKTLTKYVVESKKSLLATIPVKKKLQEEGKLELKGSLSKVWLGVPLIIEEEIIGVLAVQSYEHESAYNNSDVRLLEFVSGQIGLSIQIKRKEEELIEALKKAEEADSLKSAFLANMSHEIRTPMNGILGFTQLMKEDDLSYEERQKFLGIIEKSGNRMLNIINDLINVAKVDAGLMEVVINDVDLKEVTNYLYSFFNREVIQKGIKLRLELPEAIKEPFLKTDGEKLYAVFTNLIKNAIKYSEKGSITFGYLESDDEFEFFVEDTGIGIPVEMHKDVFSRFVQLNSTTDPFTEGSGLGLSIVKAYVELMGGKIWFESEQNVGTVFRFTLPKEFSQ